MNDEVDGRKCCDNCIFYEWYYDRCNRWMCFINNPRSVCGYWLERPTIKKVRDEKEVSESATTE